MIKRIFRTEEGAKEFVKNRPEEYNIENHFIEDVDTGVSSTDSRVFEEDIQTRPTGEHHPKGPNSSVSRGETVKSKVGEDTPGLRTDKGTV